MGGKRTGRLPPVRAFRPTHAKHPKVPSSELYSISFAFKENGHRAQDALLSGLAIDCTVTGNQHKATTWNTRLLLV